MIDFLLVFLPSALATTIQWLVFTLATVLVAVLLVRRFTSRKTLSIRTWGKPPRESPMEPEALSDGLREGLERIWRAHESESALLSAGETAHFGEPKRESEDLGSRAVSLFADNSPVGFLLSLSSRIWPSLELEGELVEEEDQQIVCCARLKKGKTYYHAWQLPIPPEGMAPSELSMALAYRVVLDTARLGVLDQSTGVGTRSWRAFRALTEAMELWKDPAFDLDEDPRVEAVEAKLSQAIRLDPGYALAYLNRGTLRLLTFRSAESNRKAREDFQEARRLAGDAGGWETETGSLADARVAGLAAMGIARTFSQERHRFGNLDASAVDQSRRAAARAVALLDRSPEALYALAFAWHCTETLEDIEKGMGYYREITRHAEGRHPAVHNNLGYILMKGGELLNRQGKVEEAQEWWRQAEKEMRLTLEISDPKRRTTVFSRANLGYLYRLQGQYSRAETEYRKALAPNPETSRYTNGLNELACLYAEWNRRDEALKYHKLALESAMDPDHEEKLQREFRESLGDAPANGIR